MSLNGNSYFSRSVSNDIKRSVFDRSNSLLTSFSSSKLIPIYVDDVLPGDTVTLDQSSLVRMSTPLFPVLDNAYLDVHWFFVPNRLVWDNWKYFMGESKSAWDDDTDYETPIDTISNLATDPETGNRNVYDYFGIPVEGTGTFSFRVNSLYRRAYQLIWNEWYRDQNLQDPLLIDTGDTGISSSGSTNLPSGCFVLPVNKYKDYFTSCLPAPQRGEDVPILPNFIPVVSTADYHDYVPSRFGLGPLRWTTNGAALAKDGNLFLANNGSTSLGADNDDTGTVIYPWNLWADTTADGFNTINDLRQAFAIQRLLETDARGGTRYRELVKAHFGVDVGDARVQVPEYLGGAHIPINVMQVVQQSSTNDEPSPLGETGAFSKTVHRQSMFTKSFVEHGILMGLAMVRTDHSYSQGIPRMFNRRSRYDYYWPELANIGEQAVLNKEIYCDGTSTDNEVFGYQEAWADYRYRPNQITGDMRQRGNGITTRHDLSHWHYGDYYESLPSLSDEWVQETSNNIARTLAYDDTTVTDQFFGQFYFRARWARPMPVYSIPGLSGHF